MQAHADAHATLSQAAIEDGFLHADSGVHGIPGIEERTQQRAANGTHQVPGVLLAQVPEKGQATLLAVARLAESLLLADRPNGRDIDEHQGQMLCLLVCHMRRLLLADSIMPEAWDYREAKRPRPAGASLDGTDLPQ